MENGRLVADPAPGGRSTPTSTGAFESNRSDATSADNNWDDSSLKLIALVDARALEVTGVLSTTAKSKSVHLWVIGVNFGSLLGVGVVIVGFALGKVAHHGGFVLPQRVDGTAVYRDSSSCSSKYSGGKADYTHRALML